MVRPYTVEQPFRFWCQKILPLVYDDSISYYELLNKVVDYLNKNVDNVNALGDAFNNLQKYVQDYFTNLDVQQEINAKLDEMVEDGTLDELILPLVGDAVSDWLEENVTPTGSAVVVDASLTISGAAADAKVTGDGISDLKSELTLFTGNDILSFIDGKYLNTSGTSIDITAFVNDSQYRVCVYPCSQGDTFTISAKGSTVARTWNFIKTNGDIISQAPNNNEIIETVFTAPEDSAYIVINDYLKTGTCYKGTILINTVDSFAKQINSISESVKTGNLYNSDDVVSKDTGSYYYKSNGQIVIGTNANFSKFLLKVKPNTIYTCNTSNVILLDANKGPIYTTGTYDYQNVNSFLTREAEFAAVSFNHTSTPEVNYIISEGTSLSNDTITDNYIVKRNKLFSIYSSNDTVLTDGNNITVKGRTAIKDGLTIVFKGVIEQFSSIRLNFVGGSSANYIDVDATNITVKNSSSNPVVYAHDLTITNDIEMLVQFINGNITVSLFSNGEVFKQENISWYQTGGTVTEHQIVSTGSNFSSSVLTVIYNGINRKIWYFGDSYSAFNQQNRWAYYANEYNVLNNMLVSGSGGGNSSITITAFITELAYGTPEFAVFATGMNDGSDTDSTPNSTWKTKLDLFIQYCQVLNITPILSTTPTVPSVNNEAKNSYVRGSGYRYIDFAKAVGANSNGEWYSGMLDSDNVHPTAKGAKALFSQICLDLPEVFMN